MTTVPAAVPRALDYARFRADPLRFLVRARTELGDIFVLREEGPVFSRTPDCSAVVVVFGAELQRAVLTDIDTFAMPPSAAKRLALPARLANLNRSLHSMRAEEHATQKRVVAAALEGWRAETPVLPRKPHRAVALLSEMRRLAERFAARTLFGDAESARLVELLSGYFHLRREASLSNIEPANHETLLATGYALDEELRRHIREHRGIGLVARLVESQLSEDEVVGHSNILFVSATEPVAIALTWTLLIISQLPDLRRQLRSDPTLVEGVLSESLRLLPPNGFMARVTSRPVKLGGVWLPERCEVVLSPFVAQRDPRVFPSPDDFHPSRWKTARPTAFEYFPFGAGGHACVGRALAIHLMRSALTAIVGRHDVVLAGDQEVDWRVHIQFMPQGDPTALFQSLEARGQGGRLLGPVGELLRLDFSPGGGVN